MSPRHDPDQLITAWVTDSVGSGGPDYLSEVLAVVERTPQQRWAKWFPGGWTVAPGKAPIVRSRMLLAAAALLLIALVASALLAGGSRRPAFVLQGVVPLPVSSDAVFASASDDALWATVGDAVLKIDPRTGTSTRFAVPNAGATLTGALGSPDSIWVADYYGNRVVRLDRSTGDIHRRRPVGEPGGLQWQDGLWVQSGSGGGAVRIAPTETSTCGCTTRFLCRDAGRALVRRGVRRQGLGRRSGPWNRGGAPADRYSSRCRAVHHHGRHGQSMDLRSAARGRTPPGS